MKLFCTKQTLVGTVYVSCSLERGHAGNHLANVTIDWEDEKA